MDLEETAYIKCLLRRKTFLFTSQNNFVENYKIQRSIQFEMGLVPFFVFFFRVNETSHRKCETPQKKLQIL